MTKQHPKRHEQAQNTAQPRTTHARTARADASRSRATRQAQEARARRTRIVWWSIGGAAALAIVMILAGLP
ncbi:hypothetical protein ACL9RL_10940 [Plantibacter sp. Mn2098]|uniref:hypothetical protein n=1 Tax=Plantibacter sp. Mn2098 TaxID=3395266 RepID=UPI003BE15E93